MRQLVNVTSEIGRLKRVLLHRPNRELENLVPEYLGRLLFDDIPYLKVAKIEHDKFAEVLRENGVEVLYSEDLLAKSLSDDKRKMSFINEFLDESNIVSPVIKEKLTDYFLEMEPEKLTEAVMAGVRKDEIKTDAPVSLSEIMSDDFPFYIDPLPNLYFTRDPATIIGNGISINHMRTEARKRETLFIKYIYKDYFDSYDVPLWYDRDDEFSIEGGDILVLSPEVIAVGCSERTSPDAIQLLAKRLFSDSKCSVKKILVFDIPKCRAFMHLDTVFTMADYNKFTIHPRVESSLNVYEITMKKDNCLDISCRDGNFEDALKDALHIDSIDFIKCGGGDVINASREQWNDGSNTLAIAPGVVVTYERNYITNEILDKNGIKVLSIPSSELSRGRGGPRCMSMPLYRENLKY